MAVQNSKFKIQNFGSKVKSFDFCLGFLIFAFCVLILTPLKDISALTRQIPASGRLETPNQTSVPDGNYTMRFSIYTVNRTTSDPYPSDSDSGSRLWTETQTVAVSRGVWRTTLGSVTALPVTLNFDSGDYFLGIRVNTDPEMVPRKTILPVPLAIDSETVGGSTPGTSANNVLKLDGSGNIDIAGNITTTGVLQGSNLVISGSVTMPVSALLLGTTSTSFVLGNATALAGNNFSLAVSVATNKPALRYNGSTNKWEVSNDGTTFADILTTVGSGITSLNGLLNATQTFGNDTNVIITSSGTTHTLGWNGLLSVSRGGTGTGTTMTAGSVLFAGASGVYSQDNTNFFWDDSTNRLGIGTTSPAELLEVYSATSDPAIRINAGGANTIDPVLRFSTGGLDFMKLFYDRSENNFYIENDYNDNTTNGNIRFVVGGFVQSQPALTLQGKTNFVGVNTSTPTAQFVVVGTTDSSGAVTMTATNGATTFTTSGNITVGGGLFPGDYIIPATTTGQARTITVGGSGSSFTITPAFSADVTGETFTIYRSIMNVADASSNTGLFVQGSTRNVGIGTTSPLSQLHVDGSAINIGQIRVSSGIRALTISQDSGSATLDTSLGWNIQTDGATRFNVSDNQAWFGGRLGIGATDKLSKLTVVGQPDQGAISGTTTANNTTTITGSSTNFLQEVGIGDRIALSSASSTYATVTAIASAGSLTIDTPLGDGTTQTIAVKHSNLRVENSANSVQLVVNDAGNVGVNTVSPNANLDVRGSLQIEAVGANDPTVRGHLEIHQQSNGANVFWAHRQTDSGSTGNFIQFQDAAISSTLFAVDINGNVGVGTGTINAASTLHVEKAGGSGLTNPTELRVRNSTGQGSSQIVFQEGTQSNNFMIRYNSLSGGTNNWLELLGSGGAIYTFKRDAARFGINTGASTDPSGNLDIRQYANGDQIIYARRNTDTTPTGNFIQFQNAATTSTLFAVDINGQVGIGTASPGTYIDVVDNTGPSDTLPLIQAASWANALFGSKADTDNIDGGQIDFRFGATESVGVFARGFTIRDETSGANRFFISPAGNVGINTIAPSARLQVQGGTTSSGATTMTASNGATTFTTSASVTINAGDYIIPTTTTGQARAVTVGGTGTSFTVSPAFSADVTGETYTTYQPIAHFVDNSGNTKFIIQGSTGAVGMGTLVPNPLGTANAALLHTVAGNGNWVIESPLGANNESYIYFSKTGEGENPKWAIGRSTWGSVDPDTLRIIEDDLEANTRFSIMAGGNVGIGTGTPSEKLEIGSGGNVLQTPGTPTAKAGMDLADELGNYVYISGRYAYVTKDVNAGTCSGATLTGCEFSIYDVSNPSSPAAIGGVNLGVIGNRVVVAGRYAYVTKNADAGTCSGVTLTGCEFSIYDVSNPASPAAVGGVDMGVFTYDVFLSGRYVYLTKNADAGTCSGVTLTGCEFSIYDVSNPSSPAAVGGVNLVDDAHTVYVVGRYAYVGKGTNAGVCSGVTLTGCELGIYDISTPSAPSAVGGMDLESASWSTYVSSRYAYVGKGTNAGTCSGATLTGCEFSIYDVSNPSAPAAVGGMDLGATAWGVNIAGRYAYLAKGVNAGTCSGTTVDGCEISVYDILNPSSITAKGGVDLGVIAWTINVSGHYAYIGKNLDAGTCSGSTVTGCEFSIYDISGIETTSLLAHSLEAGNLQVRNDLSLHGQLQVAGGANIGAGGLLSTGSISTLSSAYFSQNVGINTTTTSGNLDIRQIADGNNVIYGRRFTDSGQTGYFALFQNAAGTSDVFSVDVSGTTLIGTSGLGVSISNYTISQTGNDSNLFVSAGLNAGNLTLRPGNTGAVYIQLPNNTPLITALSSGNVGIGTLTPTERFTIRHDDATNPFALYDGANNISLAVADGGSTTVKPTTFDTVFAFDGAVYTNQTTEAKTSDFKSDNTPFALLTVEGSSDDELYLGLDHKFSKVYVDLETVGAGVTLSAQYWNGAWTALTITDGTSNLTVDGPVTFTTPANWTTTSVNSVTKYWIRLRSPATNVTTAPTASVVSSVDTNVFQVFGQSGDTVPALFVNAEGEVRVNLSGTASTAAICGSHGTGTTTPQNNVMLMDCDGAPAADYAEMYPMAKGIEFGDIVATGVKSVQTKDGDSIVQLVKSSAAYQSNIIGIVSNNFGDFTSAGYNVKPEDNPKPVALSGRVPVNVTLENGPIAVGDYLTSSSIDGAAMKAKASGFVIGKALEAFSGSGAGKVMVFVEPGWRTEPAVYVVQGGEASFTEISTGLLATKDLEVTGLAYLRGDLIVEGKVRGDLNVEGLVKAGQGFVGGWRSYENHFLNSSFENDLKVSGNGLASWEYHKVKLTTDAATGSKASLDHTLNFKPSDDEGGMTWRLMMQITDATDAFHLGLWSDENNRATVEKGTSPQSVKFVTCKAGICETTDDIAVDPTSANRNYIIMIKAGETKLMIDSTVYATHSANVPAESVLHFHADVSTSVDAPRSALVDYVGAIIGRYGAF